MLASATKRCHDLGNSGWYQLIPFYIIALLFIKGDDCCNQYGTNPKIDYNSQIYVQNKNSAGINLNKK